MIHLDTHVVCWLYSGETNKISAAARALIDENLVSASPMVELELAYLAEIGRIEGSPAEVLHTLSSEIGLRVPDTPFSQIISYAKGLHWTRDAFDRLIVAHAMAESASLITRDRVIHQHFSSAIW